MRATELRALGIDEMGNGDSITKGFVRSCVQSQVYMFVQLQVYTFGLCFIHASSGNCSLPWASARAICFNKNASEIMKNRCRLADLHIG